MVVFKLLILEFFTLGGCDTHWDYWFWIIFMLGVLWSWKDWSLSLLFGRMWWSWKDWCLDYLLILLFQFTAYRIADCHQSVYVYIDWHGGQNLWLNMPISNSAQLMHLGCIIIIIIIVSVYSIIFCVVDASEFMCGLYINMLPSLMYIE